LVYGKELQYFSPEFYPHCHMGEVGEGRLVEDGNSRKVTNDLKLGCVSLVRRRPFTTMSGLLGLAPDTTKPGDIVAILSAPYPVILRPAGDHYQFVGECFVHGLMEVRHLTSRARRDFLPKNLSCVDCFLSILKCTTLFL
jgi:hypothetical protein